MTKVIVQTTFWEKYGFVKNKCYIAINFNPSGIKLKWTLSSIIQKINFRIFKCKIKQLDSLEKIR